MAYDIPQLPPGDDIHVLRRWVLDEFEKVSRAMQETQAVELRPVYREPDKPRPGMIVYADGVEWNPGAGEGVYAYTLAAAWSKL